MENTVTSSKKRTFTAIVWILALTASTCKAPFGLGTMVDTEIPVVTIETPTRNAYVKGAMTITGKSTDDLGVTGVAIAVLAKDGTRLGTYPAALNGETYSVTVPTAGAGLEGEVVIEATASDENAKQSATRTSVFIDNIAPTALITSPLTKSPSQPVFTDSIDIKGEAFDRSPIADVTVTLYKPDGSVLAPPQKADGTNTWTTRFNLKGSIPDSILEDGASYHYGVVVTDMSGNVSSYYFHRSDIIAVKDTTAIFPSMDEIGNIDQISRAGTSGITVDELSSKRLSSVADFADFQYEKDPQIEFSYSNIESGSAADVNILSPKSKITSLVIPPTGGGAVDLSSLVSRIYDLDTDDLIVTISNTATDPEDDSDNIKARTVGDAASITINLKNGALDLDPGKYYITIFAETDSVGVSKTSNVEEFTIDAEAPLFNEASIEPTDLFRSAAFQMSFEGAHSTDFKDIVIEQSYNGGAYAIVETITFAAGIPNFTAKPSGDLPYDASGPIDNGLYNYKITLSTVGGKSTTILRSITYDDLAPSMEVTNLSPLVGANTVNGTVTLSVSAADSNGIQEVRRWILASGSTEPDWNASGYGTWSNPPYTASVDTAAVGISGSALIWVVSMDKADNKAAISYPVTIDQETDRPAISFAELDKSISTQAGASGNLLGSGGTVAGSVTDDDGVNSASVSVWNSSGTLLVNAEVLTLSGTGKTKYFNYPASSLSDGAYSFSIVALDNNAVPIQSATMTPVWFAYDTAEPTLVVSPNASEGGAIGPYRSADFTVSGTVMDASGIASLSMSLDNGSTWMDLATTAAAGETKAWSRLIDADSNDGAKSIVIRATDAFTRPKQSAAIAVTIDTVNPEGSLAVFAPGYYADAQLAINGTASDLTSGVKSVDYSVDANGNSLNDDAWYAVTGISSWFKNDIDASALAEGSATVWVRVTDFADNDSILPRTFTVDHAAPTLSVDTSFDTTVFKSTDFDIFGTVTDTSLPGSPISAEVTKLGDPAYSLTGDLNYDAATHEWAQTVNISGTGSYEITITATDSVGRKSVEKRTVIVDLVPPTVNIMSFSSYAIDVRVNGVVEFNAVSADANGIEGTRYFVTTSATAPAYSAVAGGSVIAELPEQSITTTQGIFSQLVNYYLWVVTMDKAGNSAHNSPALSFVIDQGTDRPSLSLSDLDVGITTLAGAKDNLLESGGRISGSITDDDGVASATISVWNASNALVVNAATLSLAGSGKTRTFSYPVSALADGAYKFTIDAMDINADPIHNSVMTAVWFAYDTAVPTIVFNANAVEGGAIGPYRADDFTVNGTVMDASGIGKVELSLDGGTSWIDLATTAAAGIQETWSYSITAASNNGAKSLALRATDAFSREALSSPTAVTIDTVAPSGTIAAFASGYYADTQLAASGTASDATSGVASVKYSTDSAAGPWTAVTSIAAWFKNDIPVSLLGEGLQTVWIQTLDYAGNEHVTSRDFIIDHGAPILIVDSSFSGAVFTNSAFSLFGTVTDANMGATPVDITATLLGVPHTLTNAMAYGTYGADSWSRLINIGASGVYEITITAKDNFNRTSVERRTVTIDVTPPAVEVTSVLPMLATGQVNGIVTLSVNASDSNGLEGVKYFLRTGGGAPAYSDAVTAPLSALLAAPYSAPINTTTLDDGQAYTLWVVARDKAGNDNVASAAFTVSQGTDVPAATLDSPGTGTLIGADKTVRGTFSDDDGVAIGGARLYARKVGAASYTAKSINATASTASQLVSWSVNISDILASDGAYEMYMEVSDDATKKSGLATAPYSTLASPVSFFYDINPPTVSTPSLSPSKTAYRQGDVIRFQWNASDASGLLGQTADVDGLTAGLGLITLDSETTYHVDFTVPAGSSGNRIFTLVATDNTGKSATRTVSITVDVDAPEVEDAFTLDPAFVGFTPNGNFTIRGTASDNRALSNVQVNLSGPTANDGAVSSDGNWHDAILVNGNWSYAVTSGTYVAMNGNLVINVRATDQAGNVCHYTSTGLDYISFTLAVDQNADRPTATIISPVTASTYGSTVQISGTAADDDGLWDAGGTSAIAPQAITIEYWLNAVPGTVYTANPSVIGTGRNATWNYAATSLTGGAYTVRVRSRDDAGSYGDWTVPGVEFTVDTGVPNLILLTDFATLTYTDENTMTITGTVQQDSGVRYVRARVGTGAYVMATAAGITDTDANGEWDQLPATTTTWTVTVNLGLADGTQDGQKTIEFIAEKVGGAIATVMRTTNLDTTAPEATFDSSFRDHPTGSYLALAQLNGQVRITGTVTELNLRDASPVEISIRDGVNDAYVPVNSGSLVWYHVWNTPEVENVNYDVYLRITDKAGNETVEGPYPVTVRQSADDPQISQGFITAPAPGDAGNNILGSLLKVSGTITDDDGFNTAAVRIYLDGSTTPINASNTTGTTAAWEYTWAVLAKGEHRLRMEATDRNGSIVSLGPTYFLVDTLNPVITLGSPPAGAKIKAGLLTISGTATDDGGFNASPLKITLRHTDTGSSLHNDELFPVLSGDDFSVPITIDSLVLDGTLYIDLELSDRAGRISTTTRAVVIDTTPPSLDITYPAPGASINGLVSFVGTADDLNGLSSVTLQLLNPGNLNIPVATIDRVGSSMAAWEFLFNAAAYAGGAYGIDVNGDGKLWRVYYRLAATDNSGNLTEYKVSPYGALDYPFLLIDTDGDKPSISVTQPKNGDRMGGFVNMFGSASDDDGPVMQVEVQIDFNGNNNFTDSRDINNNDGDADPLTGIAMGAAYDVFGTSVRYGNATVASNVVTVSPGAAMWEDETSVYVIETTNNAWSTELNVAGELYASNTGGTGNVTIRVRSRDQFGLASEWSTRTITLDETFPRIQDISPTDQTYQTGTVSLMATFGDNDPLGSGSVMRLTINKTTPITLTAGANNGTTHPYSLVANVAENGFDLVYPIVTSTYLPSGSGILYADLYVMDEADYTNQKSLTFYVDNQSPTSAWTTLGTGPSGLDVRNGQVTINNGSTSLSYLEGDFSDSGTVSGIDRIEVFFARGTTVYPIVTPNVTTTPGTESVVTETYNENTSIWSSGNQDLPLATWATADYGDDYVMRIDQANELTSDVVGADVDSDGYYEKMGFISGAMRWRVYFDSSKLPDGTMDIHYVVYDLAGNRTHRVRRGFIANNGPVINSVAVGSDYNANGAVANVVNTVTEIVTYTGTPQRVVLKNGRLYLRIQSSDLTGTNQGIDSVTVRVTSGTPLGVFTTFSTEIDKTDVEETITIPSGGFLPSAGDYTLQVAVKDEDGISAFQDVLVRVVDEAGNTRPTVSPTTISQANGIPVNDNGTPADDSDDYAIGHLELQSDNVTRWAAIMAAYDGDNDVKVSGEVYLRGTITDDNRLNRIGLSIPGVGTDVQMASWNAGLGMLTSSDPARFSIVSQSLTESGHVVEYRYLWNSATVPNTASYNQGVAFNAADAATVPLTSIAHALVQYDVVPYISGIRRSTDYNTLRSRYGRYLVYRGETITVNGFNVWNAATDTLQFGSAAATTISSGAATGFDIAVPATAKSGNLTLTVNGRVALNNINDNTLSYNKEVSGAPLLDGSTYWNDDRSLHVWRSDSAQTGSDRGYFTGSIDPEYPAMSMDPATGILYGSWSNYATSDVIRASNASAAVSIYSSYDPLEHTDIDYGARQAIVYNANTYGAGLWDQAGAGGVQIWDTQATVNPADGSATGNFYNMEELYHDQKLMQFINPRVATDGNDIHISYFDTDTKALKYSYQLSGSTSTAENTNWINIDGGADGDDGTATNVSATKAMTSVTYVSTAPTQNNLSSRTGTFNTWSVAVNAPITNGQTIATRTGGGGTSLTSQFDGILISQLVTTGATLTLTTPIATVMVDTTVSTVHHSVGDYVGIGEPLVTMANGTVVTSSVAGYITTILAVGATAQHNTTTAAIISSFTVQSIQKPTGSTVAVNDVILTLSDATTVVATAAGVLTYVAPTGTPVGTATLMASSITTARVVSGSRSAAAGEYSAIDTTPAGYPVIAYYDITNQTVKLARSTSANPQGADWRLQTVLDNETIISSWKDSNFKYSGKYITVKIDAAGYVHLAFYRNSTGDLIYMKSSNNPSTGATPYTFGPSVIVDSIGSVGVWADLAIHEPTPGSTTDDDARPYISYLDSSLANTFDGIKVAYWNPALERASETLVSGGVDNAAQPDSPDGWELMNAPMSYEVEGARTSVEFNTISADYGVSIGYSSTDYFRVGYYVKE